MPKRHEKPRLILASGSAARAAMLRSAGLTFKIIPADVDEKKITAAFKTKNASPRRIAAELAAHKALAVSAQNPGALVIGSDQVLAEGGRLMGKARSKAEATKKLKMLRRKTHVLISAAAIAQNGTIIWRHADSAALTMRDFSPAMLRAYLDAAGDALTRAVGAYEAEGLGAWLFETVRGDHFTVMGMPLLPLLAHLDEIHGVRP